MTNYWASIYVPNEIMGAFEYHGPWWISGETDDEQIICAAVQATSEDAASSVLVGSFDEGADLSGIRRRFVEERGLGWSPFSDRFQKADWMKWPLPTKEQTND